MKKRIIEWIVLGVLVVAIPFAYAAGIAISGLTAITGDAAVYNDVLPIVDVSDTSQAATGSTRKILYEDLTKALISVDSNGMSQSEMAAVGSSGAVFFAGGGWHLESSCC